MLYSEAIRSGGSRSKENEQERGRAAWLANGQHASVVERGSVVEGGPSPTSAASCCAVVTACAAARVAVTHQPPGTRCPRGLRGVRGGASKGEAGILASCLRMLCFPSTLCSCPRSGSKPIVRHPPGAGGTGAGDAGGAVDAGAAHEGAPPRGPCLCPSSVPPRLGCLPCPLSRRPPASSRSLPPSSPPSSASSSTASSRHTASSFTLNAAILTSKIRSRAA